MKISYETDIAYRPESFQTFRVGYGTVGSQIQLL